MNFKAIAAIALTLIIAVPIGAGYLFAVHDEDVTSLQRGDAVSISDLLLNDVSNYSTTYTGVSNNSYLTVDGATTAPSYVKTGSTVTAYPTITATASTVNIIRNTAPYYIHADDPAQSGSISALNSTLKVNVTPHPVGTTDLECVKAWRWFGNGILVVTTHAFGHPDRLSETTFTDVTTAQFYSQASNYTANITTFTTSTTNFADASYGWKMPANADGWSNGHLTEAVSFMVNLNGLTTAADELLTMGAGGAFVHLGRPTGTTVTVDGEPSGTYDLGDYDLLRVTFDAVADEITVEGIAAWPAFGFTPSVLNSVTIPATIDTFERVSIMHTELGEVELAQYTTVAYRVDSSTIQGGTFPVTKDYTLRPAEKFPGTSLDVVINGADIYGDSLTVGGVTYTVDNGSVTVDGEKVRLKGASFRILKDGATYTTTLNGHELASGASPSITFDGKWSLTASVYKLNEVTTKTSVWHAGEFGLDKTGIAAVGLLVCGGLLVGLGMTGPRSGVKIGALLLICGGAAIIYLTLI